MHTTTRRSTSTRAMTDVPAREQNQPAQVGEPARLVLTDAQVEEVLRGIAGGRQGGLHGFLLAQASRLEQVNTSREKGVANGRKLSLSLLRALMILRFLALEGEQPLCDIAGGVEGTPSTTRRYLTTLKKVGLIEQSEATRTYRLAMTLKKKAHRQPPAMVDSARVALCDVQVEEVLRGIAQTEQGGLRGLLVGRTGRLEQLGPLRDRDLPDDPELSRSLLRALLIIRFLFLAGRTQPLYAIAPGVGLSHSTTHRYLMTLKQVGLVEQIEATQKYRLASWA
jgi:DNA-binding transcriptional ArsR family regulator